MKGGYKLIDLHNVDLTIDEPTKIVGVHNAIEESHRKSTLLTGIVIAGVEKPSRYVVFGVDSGTFKGGMGYTPDGDVMGITVTVDDMVTITSTI